ncbi:hypothetical protein BC827DRAFT_1297101 [Russula dissimulans]|nr:hypothetical protein BC827DRAFT_1297101 [Russula dissimulans]
MSQSPNTNNANFSAFNRGRGGVRPPKPDLGNRYYVRGGTSGSNFRGGRGRAMSNAVPNSPQEVDIKEGLDKSKIIETIPQPSREFTLKDLPIENVKYVASYNWVETQKPTIVVPGSPPVWTGRDLPFTLRPDTGENFIDQNTTRIADYPMLPLFTAADVTHDDKAPVDWPTVDVISDRNGLRKLLRWLNPSAGREVRDFRIDVELVGPKTIILIRRESTEYQPLNVRSFGFSFEEAMTLAAPGCPASGHHRAITYRRLNVLTFLGPPQDMHGVKMIIRFEVDACSSTGASAGTATKSKTPDAKRPEKKTPGQTVDDLANTLGGMNLSTSASASASANTPKSASPEPLLNIVHAGTQVPQDALLELTSRSVYFLEHLDWNELYPQLALSQTPTLHLGVHERGQFTELREWRVDGAGASTAPELAEQRQRTAMQLARLARVLEEVQELAISRGPGPASSFSLVCEGGKLNVYGRKSAKSCLPPDVKERFGVAGAGA